MTKHWTAVGPWLLLSMAFTSPAQSSETPVLFPPEICDLAVKVDAASNGVTVSWSGGTPPFAIVRGDAARFDQATEIKRLAEDVRGHSYVDSGALNSGRRYYYQVYDGNSRPEIYSITGPSVRLPQGGASDPPDGNYCGQVLRRPATWGETKGGHD